MRLCLVRASPGDEPDAADVIVQTHIWF